MKLIYDTCKPRPDVESGATRDEQFAADLAKVINGTAPDEYKTPSVFFSHTYPTRGLKSLLKAVCQRLSGKGGEVASIIRLHTQYGGGKTHGLIALVHAVQGMQGVSNVEDFIDPALLPSGPVRVAALDGENSDPANGLTLEGDLRAYSLWGDLAYRLAGRTGYERVAESDKTHVAPGATTISELFGGEPTLIMLDEVSVYLRKVEQARPGASDQFTAFVHALFKAVTSSPNVALVYTLAVGKDASVADAYKREHERALAALAEAEVVSARQTTQLNPTEEDETADVLRRRLFESVDLAESDEVISSYVSGWNHNRDSLPPDAVLPETRDQFRRSYPLHPELLEMLTEKTSSLSTFQRTRGMLRLLARTVHLLWKDRQLDACAIHTHHMDPGFGPIRDEITVKLQQGEYTPALKADVAAVHGDEPSLAQQLDREAGSGSPPVHSRLAHTIFWHTLAYGNAVGLGPEHLRFSVCSPEVEPSFVEQARVKFVTESIYLDDRPGAPLRFMVEPNLTQVIRKQMDAIEGGEVRAHLHERIRQLFESPGGSFKFVPFPAGPYEVEDETASDRPLIVAIGYEALALPTHPDRIPSEIEEIFQHSGERRDPRKLRNNLIFVAADERLRENMVKQARRHLALGGLHKEDRIRQLADYQEKKVKEEFEKSKLAEAEAILHCYRHLFYPSNMAMPGASVPLSHTIIELLNASDSPGDGQRQVERILHEQKKLLLGRDQPDAPAWLRDQTQLKTKGEVTTAALRDEYRRAPQLAIMLHDTPFLLCVRDGIEQGVFIYREDKQVWGPGDPTATVQVSENAFVHTVEDAKKKKLWPRAQPLVVTLTPSPATIAPGQPLQLTVEVSGGVAPFTYASSEAGLTSPPSTQTSLRATVTPSSSATYEIEVIDSRGDKRTATAHVQVVEGGAPPPPPPPDLQAQGPLAQALAELWEKARKAKHERLYKIVIRLFDAPGAWKVHQGAAVLRDVEVRCQFRAEIDAEGVDEFTVSFAGEIAKANPVKSFLDPQLRASLDSNFQAEYTLGFASGVVLDGDSPETLAKDLTRFGGGEAYVEAYAVPPEE